MTRVAQEVEEKESEKRSSSLDELAREGARKMIEAALLAEADEYLAQHAEARDAVGHAMVVRNGKARERPFTVGSGTVTIVAQRVNDKRVVDGDRPPRGAAEPVRQLTGRCASTAFTEGSYARPSSFRSRLKS